MSIKSSSEVDRNDVLFRLWGEPVYSGSLAFIVDDPDVDTSPTEQFGIVLDYVWDQDAGIHLVHFLVDSHVIRVSRDDIRLP